MTRHPWTTEKQRDQLESHKSAYIEASENKTAAKDFFPDVFKEFREQWPVLPVTEQEIEWKGSVERATKIKKDKYDKVDTHFDKTKR